MVVVAPIEEMRISSENDLVEFLRTIAENTEWKGESRVITLVVALSLLGAPEELDQERIDFFEKRTASISLSSNSAGSEE